MAEKFDLDSLEDELAKEEGVSRRDYIAKGKSKERTSLLKKNKAGIQLENTKTKAEKEAEMQKAKSVAKNIAYISLHYVLPIVVTFVIAFSLGAVLAPKTVYNTQTYKGVDNVKSVQSPIESADNVKDAQIMALQAQLQKQAGNSNETPNQKSNAYITMTQQNAGLANKYDSLFNTLVSYTDQNNDNAVSATINDIQNLFNTKVMGNTTDDQLKKMQSIVKQDSPASQLQKTVVKSNPATVVFAGENTDGQYTYVAFVPFMSEDANYTAVYVFSTKDGDSLTDIQYAGYTTGNADVQAVAQIAAQTAKVTKQ